MSEWLCDPVVRVYACPPAQTLLDLARDLNTQLEVREVTRGVWTVQLESVEVKTGCMLSSVHGRGVTPYLAAFEYCEQLSGQHVVAFASDPVRRRELYTSTIHPPSRT